VVIRRIDSPGKNFFTLIHDHRASLTIVVWLLLLDYLGG
jgi:hypothetical protein